MQIAPLSVLAKWPTPNYKNPKTQGPENTIIISILLGIVTTLIGIRLYARIKISKGFGLDDVLIILAYIPATAFAVGGIVAEHKLDWDRHAWDVRPEFITPGLQLSMATQILFDIATSLTKLSMLALMYRLMTASQSRMRYVAIALALIIAANCFIFVVVTVFQCSPVADYWTLSLTPQKCINEEVHLLAAGIINTTTDFLIVLLPVPTVFGLNLPFKQLLIVQGLFTGGVLASVAGAVRTYFTWVMTTSADHDITWNAYIVILLSSLELYIGIICASLPATKPFFSRYLPRFLGTARFPSRSSRAAEKVPSSRRSSLTTFCGEPKSPVLFYMQQHPSAAELPLSSPSRARLPPPNLNKPLPKIYPTASVVLERSSTQESVYQFTPYEDGHISVHKARKSQLKRQSRREVV